MANITKYSTFYLCVITKYSTKNIIDFLLISYYN